MYLLVNVKKGDVIVASTVINWPVVALLKNRAECQIFLNEIRYNIPLLRHVVRKALSNRKIEKIYLSKFVENHWALSGPHKVQYPRLRKEIVEAAKLFRPASLDKLTCIGLVGSFIPAKGYEMFIELSRLDVLKRYQFRLCLSGDESRFRSFFPRASLPDNLTVIFNQTGPEVFSGIDIFLGLTDPAKWVETFGMTFAEAMLFRAIPVVPQIGAQTEYIHHGVNGFYFCEYEKESILEIIYQIENLKNVGRFRERLPSTVERFSK